MEKQNKNFTTTDLKLYAFLHLMLPSSFIGLNKTNPNKVLFIFSNSSKLMNFVKGYSSGKKYKFSPFHFANNIDQGKSMLFGSYEV